MWGSDRLAVKRSAGVALEVDAHGIFITYTPAKQVNKAIIHSAFETQIVSVLRHQKSKTGIPVALQNIRTCVPLKTFSKKPSKLKQINNCLV